ncbi:hypothetical protein, partial [Raoultella terrigena]|uniref:hypothetical protein n=1 Tax=Raoultella terrigena TaxID=577 RepID=UPI001C7040D1
PTLDQMSEAGRKAVSDWERSLESQSAATADHVRLVTELAMKREVVGLSEEEDAAMTAAAAASKIDPVAMPELSPSDMKTWQAYGRRKQIMKRVELAVIRVMLAIDAARGRD